MNQRIFAVLIAPGLTLTGYFGLAAALVPVMNMQRSRGPFCRTAGEAFTRRQLPRPRRPLSLGLSELLQFRQSNQNWVGRGHSEANRERVTYRGIEYTLKMVEPGIWKYRFYVAKLAPRKRT